MAQLVTDALSWWTRALPDREAIACGDDVVTYAQLGTWTDAVARDLAENHGVKPGDVVALAGLNSLEWCIAALGVIKAGGVVTPCNFRYTVSELEMLVVDSTANLIIADETEAPKVAQVRERGHSFATMPLARVAELRAGGAPFHVEIDPSAPVILAYTSGTTGKPKGLTYTHETVLNALFELILKDPIPPEQCNLMLALPLFSVAGIMHTVTHVVCRGGKAVIMRDFEPKLALRLLAEERISNMNGVPVIYERMSQQPEFADLELSHLKVAMVGGARVSEELLAAWNSKGVALRHMYGMTEVGGCGTVPRPADALARPDLCGDGSIFTEVRTMRSDGTFCAPGEEGEIVMRGPGRMVGYWRNPEATAEVIKDDWLHSGDLGVIDENGYLKFVDRLKDLIISGGFNVAPTEVENVISRVPGVIEVAVIAVNDTQWGETPAAIIHGDANLDLDAVDKLVRSELAVFKVPRYLVTTDEPLPRMASGKIAKRQLREDYATPPADSRRG